MHGKLLEISYFVQDSGYFGALKSISSWFLIGLQLEDSSIFLSCLLHFIIKARPVIILSIVDTISTSYIIRSLNSHFRLQAISFICYLLGKIANRYLKSFEHFLEQQRTRNFLGGYEMICVYIIAFMNILLDSLRLSFMFRANTQKTFSNKMRKYTNVLIRNCCTVFRIVYRLYSVWLKQILRIYTHIKS